MPKCTEGAQALLCLHKHNTHAHTPTADNSILPADSSVRGFNLSWHFTLFFPSSADFKGATNFFSQPKENVWGPSLEEFLRRFHPANVPESLGRLRNLFLAYTVELRAIAKAAPLLRQQAFYTGDVAVDTQTRSMALDILDEVE